MLCKHEIMQIGNINLVCLFRIECKNTIRFECKSVPFHKNVFQFVIIDVYKVDPIYMEKSFLFFSNGFSYSVESNETKKMPNYVKKR